MSLLGTLGGIVGGITGFATGGIGGAIQGYQAGSHLGGGGSSPNLPALPGSPGTGVVPYGTGVNRGPFIGIPAAFGGPQNAQQGMTVHGHYTKGTARNPSHWSNRRRPRMNPMNVRAARRAVSRIHAAEKLFRRVLTVSHPGKATGRIAPKRKRHA